MSNLPMTKKDWDKFVKICLEIFAKPIDHRKRKGLWFWSYNK